jgi:antitoxin component of MazEF toxin-antitoxin module
LSAAVVKVQACGNSLELRIPSVNANALGVGSGSEMELKMEDGALLARLAKPIHAEALLAEITAENKHSSSDWGDGSGGEAW